MSVTVEASVPIPPAAPSARCDVCTAANNGVHVDDHPGRCHCGAELSANETCSSAPAPPPEPSAASRLVRLVRARNETLEAAYAATRAREQAEAKARARADIEAMARAEAEAAEAVRDATLDVANEFETQTQTNVVASPTVSLEDASTSLHETFSDERWYVASGVSDLETFPVQHELVVYANRKPRAGDQPCPATWKGYPVRLIVSGAPKPS